MKVPAAFKDIAPMWYDLLSNAKTTNEVPRENNINARSDGVEADKGGLNVSQYGCCLVGEAYGFDATIHSSQYGCEECLNISNTFGQIIHGGLDSVGNRKKMLRVNLKEFTNHWRKEHAEQTSEIAITEAEEKLLVQVKRERLRMY